MTITDEWRGVLELLLDFQSIWKEIFPLLTERIKGPGHPPKTRLGQFCFFIYLLYFSKDPYTRVINSINRSPTARRMLCLGNERLTLQSFLRFLDWLEKSRFDFIFTQTVRLGIEEGILSLDHLLTDSGPVHTLVNGGRVITFPKGFYRGLFHVFNRVDFSGIQAFEHSGPGRVCPIVLKVKVYLTYILCGLGSVKQFYRFLEKNPLIHKLLGKPDSIPCYNTMTNFVMELTLNEGLKKAFQELLPDIWTILSEIKPKNLPRKPVIVEDLYGTLGTKYSRVDRDARIGSKGKPLKVWFGYKDHVTVDRVTGLPVLVTITAANAADTTQFPNHVNQIVEKYGDLIEVKDWTADRGYDSLINRQLVRNNTGATPQIIKRNASDDEVILQKFWNSHRQVVEHVISRSGEFTRKKYPRVRNRRRVSVWVQMSYFIVLAVGLGLALNGEPERVREISYYLS